MFEASDVDDGSNGQIHYSIIDVFPWVDAFEIDSMMGVIDVTSPLDYDTLHPSYGGKYELTVMAKDYGHPPLNSTTPVYVYVQGVNDNDPYFLQSEYSAEISDDFKGGDYVITVAAFDDDSPYGPFRYDSCVDYSIVSGGNDKFSLSPTYGKHNNSYSNITIALNVDNMDVELYGNFYNMTLRASDRGNPRLDSHCTVIVHVRSTLDKPPEFRAQDVFEIITEDAPPGYYITTMGTTLTGNFIYDIVGVHAFNERDENVTDSSDFTDQFTIDGLTGDVHLNEPLDREEVEFFNVYVTVSSMTSNDSSTDQAVLRIKVMDVNDNTPVFKDSDFCDFGGDVYYAEILEEYPEIQTYSCVKASDPDKGTNGDFEFSVLTDPFNPQGIEIDRHTGDIKFYGTLDREESDQFNITVRAEDKGFPALHNDIPVVFRLVDINDNEPEFLNLPNDLSVYEDATIGSSLYTVSAEDIDDGNNAEIEYSIIAGNSEGRFTINNHTGAVHLIAALDREYTAEYDLTIQAEDNPGDVPQLRTFSSLHISVLDVNDNTPMFTESNYSIEVREDEPTGKVIAIVTAEDPDADENGFVEYSIGERNDTESGDELFSITTVEHETKNTGEVYVSSATLLDRQGVYFLELIATDQGTPSLSSSVPLIVTVQDTNVNAPEFQYVVDADGVEQPISSNFSQYVNITEDYTGFICQVHATDDDLGENARVNYLLSQSRDYFDIDPNSGNVTISHVTDREVIPSYMFSVIAHDNGTPMQMSTELLITVLVDDINDNPPVFPRNEDGSPQSDVFHVSEEAEFGTLVGTVTEASDADIGSNAVNYYFLIGGDDDDQFNLDKYTRELTVKDHLDREEIHLYELIVKADDDEDWTDPAGGTDFDFDDTSLNLVKVYIDDINDSPPSFCYNESSQTRPEASRRRRDIDINQDMFHAGGLQNWNDVYFLSKVDEEGHTSHPTLFMMEGSYDSNAAKHNIRIRAVSQEAAEIDSAGTVLIPENSPEGSDFPVDNLIAEDPDDLENGTFSLTVLEQGGYVFEALPEVVKNVASLIILRVLNSTYLDYEERHYFFIELLAEEIRTEENFLDNCKLTILLEDLNDNCPIFNQTEYVGDVVEHAQEGDFVLLVTASDLDSGEYGTITYGLMGEGSEK
ncbi:cadherin-23-like [Ptychodera flava]|uniref:cadherin-23-like n=1 Tax=Ptychodera flava TaxID=63121 RepID=UPI003969FA65